jgi:hypothetical protein
MACDDVCRLSALPYPSPSRIVVVRRLDVFLLLAFQPLGWLFRRYMAGAIAGRIRMSPELFTFLLFLFGWFAIADSGIRHLSLHSC